VLLQVKDVYPSKVLPRDMVEQIIKCGDDIWETFKEDNDQDSEDLLNIAFYSYLEDAGIHLTTGTVCCSCCH
jgi:hypothetical protein